MEVRRSANLKSNIMNISLIPDHEKYIESRIQSGVYQSIDELMTRAIALLIESEEEEDLVHDPAWIESTRYKVTTAIESLKSNGGTKGETAISQLLDRYQQHRNS
jgi:antitoxin ParD1/3/4